jgi:large subunit ribosomal protein L30
MATKKKAEQSTVRLRQVRSGIGFPVEMRETLRALGLRRMHQVVERRDTPEVRGMIRKINHLVEIVD